MCPTDVPALAQFKPTVTASESPSIISTWYHNIHIDSEWVKFITEQVASNK
jgi:hypothetical protein